MLAQVKKLMLKKLENCHIKKQGRLLLLADAMDHQVQEYVKDLRKCGLPINTSLVVAAGEGIVVSKYAGSDDVEGSMFNLTTDWAKPLLGRMGYVMRKACSKSKVDVAQFEVLKSEFLPETQNIVCMDSIPLELVINF